MPTFEELLREAKRPSENNFNSMLASIKNTARNQPWEDADYMTNTTGLTPDFYTGSAQPQVQQPEPTPMQPHFIQPEDVAAPSTDPTELLYQARVGSTEEDRANMASMLQQGQDMKNASMGGLLGGISNLGDAVYYAGDKLGLDGIANAGADFARAVAQKAADYNSQIYDNNLVNRTLAGAFSSLPYMLPGLGLGYIGGLGGKALAWTAGALSGSMETLGNTGQIQRELIDRGVDPEVARASANKNFLPELLLDTVTNRFGFPGNVDKILNPTLSAIASDAIGNFLQEPGQAFLSKAAEQSGGTWGGFGNELKKQITDVENLKNVAMEEGVPAALSSVGMGLFGSAFGGLRQNRAQTPQEKQTIANVQKVQEAFANAAQAGHVYTAPGATENVGTATAAAPMPSTTGTGFEGVDISKGFSPTTTTTATLPGQLVPQGLSDIANPSQGTISTSGYPLPGVIPTTAPTTPSGKPQQTVMQGNAAQVGQAIATTPQPAAQPTAQTPGDVTRVPVSVRGGTDENGNFVLGSDVGDAIRTLIGINGQQPTQSPQAPAQQPTAPANVSRVVTPDGNTEIETHYAVVPAESLVTSNTPDFGVNQAYPAELQPRDRTRTANQTNVMNITRNLDPARLADSRLTSEGAPIVDANGVVESGNGRTLALMRGYREGAQTMQGYRQYLLDNAARLGLDPAQVAGVQNPVLVRVRDTQMTPEQRVAFANASNRSSIAGMSATEQARMDAGNLTADILATYNPDLQQTAAGQRDFHKAFLATIPQNEHNNLINERGEPTPQLIQRERNALVFAATGDEQLAARMTETNDDNVKTVSTALIQAAPRLARINAEMKAGRLRSEYDLSKDLADAANWLSELRANGQRVEDHLNQLNAFSDFDRSDETKLLLKFFDENKNAKKIKIIRDALINYANSVERLGAPNEQSLFDDVTPPSKMDLLRSALDRAMSGEGTQGTLFGNKDAMFIGQKGARNLDAASGLKYEDQASRMYNNWIAEQMGREGKDPLTILLATGWQRLKDGHWRYELTDGTFTPVPGTSAVTKSRFTVGDVYDDKQLFDAYPQLKDIPLLFKNLGSNIGGYVGGATATGQKVMVLNTSRLDLNTRVLNPRGQMTLLHEIQHLVQDEEGFAQGGNEKNAKAAFKRQYGQRVNEIKTWLNSQLPGDVRDDWVNAAIDLSEANRRQAKLLGRYESKRENLSEWDKNTLEKNIARENRLIAEARQQLDEIYAQLPEKTAQEARTFERDANLIWLDAADDLQKYKYLLGEAESRNTGEQRIGMSEAERRRSLAGDTADIALGEAIVNEAGTPAGPLSNPNAVQAPAPSPSPAQAAKPATKPAPTTGGFFGGQGTFGFGDDGGTQGTLFSRTAPTVQTAKQIAAEVQDVRKQLVEDLKAAGRDEQSAKAEAQLVAAYFGRTANEARKAGMALSVRDQYERFKVEQGIAPQKGENVYEQPERDLTQTPAFKRWFGDSKVVDENGDPLVVYHGTGTEGITEFKHSKATDKTGRQMALGEGKGKFYFTANRNSAQLAAEGAVARGQGKSANVMPVYLSLRNPISLSEYRSRYETLSGHRLNEGYAGNYTSAVRDKYIAQLDRMIKKEGHDGIADPENGYYVAFDPNQIKSVDNRGTFDESPNIYYSREAPEQKNAPQEAERVGTQKTTQPSHVEEVGTGEFGPMYRGIEGEQAIDHLLKVKQGEVLSAMKDPRLGENDGIDFVYGVPGDPNKRYRGGYGIAHIEAKHGAEAVALVPKIIREGTFTYDEDTNSVIFQSEDGKVVLQRQWHGNPKNWVLTSYAPNINKDPRPAREVQAGGVLGEPLSSPNGDLSKSLSQTAAPRNTSTQITGPTLTERGAAFQTQTGRDYSFGTGRSSSKQSSTKASEAQTLTSLRDIQNAVAELAPVRRGLSVRNRNVLGYFKRDAGVIRSRYSHDAETILHEAGHKLDQALKIRQSVAESQQAKLTDELCELGKGSSPAEYGKIYDTVKGNEQLLLPVIGDLERGIRRGETSDAIQYLRKEGIAEFFRLYAYDRQQAEAVAPTYAKMFNEILEKNPEYASTVRKILDTVQGYETQSDHQKVVSGIVRGEVKQRGKTWRESLRNGFEEFRRNWDDRGRPLQKMEQDVLKWAIDNKQYQMLVKDKNGEYHLKDEYAPYQRWRTAPGYQGAAQERVEAIVEPLRKLGEEKYEQLLDYIVSKRALDYYAAGMEPGIGLRSEDHTRAHIAEIEAAHPDVVKLANQLRDIYEKNTHDMMVGGGIWSQEEYDRIKKENPNYAPLMRVDDDGGMKWAVTGGGQNPVNASKGLKKKKGVGSDRAQMDVIDPINSMIHNILAFQKLSERNQVAQALVNAGEPMRLVEQVEGGEKNGGNTFHVWKDGEQVFYAADKNLIDTLQMLTQVVPQNQAMRIMSKASNILKMFATQLNPAFWAVNLTRDAMQVGITTQSNMAPLYQTYKGLKILLGKDAESMRIKKLAAESGLFHSGVTEQDLHDAKAIDTYLRHAIGDENLWQKFKSFYKSTVGQWNENVEVAPKLAEFAYALKQGVPLREAAVRGREVNLDFDRGGVSAKQINPVIAFFNPAVQGASKTIRTLPRFKTNPSQMMMKVGLYMMLPSIITWALGHDDDEYKRISREFKDRYWIFKVGGTWARIPKPEGFGLFGSITERLLDYESKNDPDAFRQLGTTLWNNFMPNYFPTLFQPIIEHITGTSLFTGHDIIPRRLQDLPPEMQYTRNTSGLAKLLGRTWKLSPIIIDNYIKGYTAGAGQMATGLPDYILDKLGLSGEAPREERKWTEAPIISRFTVDPDRNSETIKRFYDYKRQTTVAKKGYQARRKTGETAVADVDVRAADLFEKAGKKMSEKNKLYAQVQESRKYTPERKREILDGIRRQMNDIAKNALDRYYKLRG